MKKIILMALLAFLSTNSFADQQSEEELHQERKAAWEHSNSESQPFKRNPYSAAVYTYTYLPTLDYFIDNKTDSTISLDSGATLSDIGIKELINYLPYLQSPALNNVNILIKATVTTDDTGSDDYNKLITQHRAEAVIKFIKEHNIKSDDFIAEGKGNFNFADDLKYDCHNKYNTPYGVKECIELANHIIVQIIYPVGGEVSQKSSKYIKKNTHN